MSKVSITSLADLNNSNTAVTTLNSNFTSLQTGMDNTLSRDGSVPNQMGSTLDMNSNRIINLPVATSAGQPITYETFNSPLVTKGNVPSGGVSGQVLSKHSNTDFDTVWSTFGTVAGTFTLAPPAGLTQAFNTTQSLTGTTSANCDSGSGIFGYPCVNSFIISSDTVDATSPSEDVDGWQFSHNTSAGIKGARQTVDATLNFHGASSAGSLNRNYVALTGQINIFSADGGTGTSLGNAQGAAFGGNFVVRGTAAATNWLSVTGLEIDMNWAQPVAQRLAIALVSVPGSQGVVHDAAVEIGSQSGAGNVGWKNGVLFSNLHGRAPLDTAGCALCPDGSTMTVGSVLDWGLGGVTISNWLVRGPGFSVDGSGNLIANSGKVTGTTFANLPSPSAGMFAYITDALAGSCGDSACNTFGTTVTGGTGTLKRLVWYNGTNWTIVGK